MELFHRMAESAQKFDYRNDKQPLVSLYIISYNNVHLLYHAIKSVLAQTHGNIEITISDDASVGCTIEDSARLVCLAALDLIFEQNEIPEDTVFCYPWRQAETISADKRTTYQKAVSYWEKSSYGTYQAQAIELIPQLFTNIRSVNFRRNRENMGTVKHLKQLKRAASGKYVMFLAADDKLHDCNVIRDMIGYFEQLPDDAYVLTSQCGMYDDNLCNLLYYAVNDELKDIIANSTPMQLFGELADWCIIPAAGTIYKKKVFEIYGDLDDRYHLIEDWTYFLKLARSGAKIYFYDRLTYMHRDGGISHGNTAGGSLAYRYYLEDCLLLTQQEILPFLDQVTPSQRKRSLRRYKDTRMEYMRKYQFKNISFLNKISYFAYYIVRFRKKIMSKSVDFFNYRAKWAFLMGTLSIIFSFLISIAPNPAPFSELIYRLLGCGGLILYFGATLTKCLFFLKNSVLHR